MRWAGLFMLLAILCAVAVVVRGVSVFDGVSLLAVVFVALALLSALLTRRTER